MIFWHVITILGDTNATMPAAAGIFCWLLAGRAWRMALQWALLFGGALVLVAATKIAFIGWGIGIRPLDFTGISGHAMRAVAVFPVIAWLLAHGRPLRVRAVALAAGFLVSVLICLSRLAVHAHSLSEVIAGCLLGAAVCLELIRMTHSMRIPAARRWIIVLSLLVMLPAFRISPAPTERWITGVALYLSGHDKPFRREEWLRHSQ
jgi:membrane-associated phospholipid phosphatase